MENSSPETVAVKRCSLKRRVGRIALGVVIGFGLLAGGVVGLVYTLGEHETLYEGKPIFQWIAQAQSKNAALSNSVNTVLNRTVIPQLTRTMFQDTNDSRIRLALIDYLNTLPNVSIFFRKADTRRADAAGMLGEFGPSARAAGPALLQALQGRDLAVRAAAAGALGKIQTDPATVIPLLIKYLDDEDLNSAAALALADYGPPAEAAVPKLIELSKLPDKDLRRAVTQALSKIQPAAAANAGMR